MLVSERNAIFEHKKHLIHMTMCKHKTLIIVLRMNPNDVYQDLALSLLMLLERYNSDKCGNADAYLMLNLKYALWNLRKPRNCYGITNAPKCRISVTSLQVPDIFGNEQDIPDRQSFEDAVWIKQEIESLPPEQRKAVSRLFAGKRVASNNKNLIAVRKHFKNILAA